ncbi:MAG: hypothetical protein H6R15_4498 [Proteobacteria bacterium]|nr:hypothetical protein [Pseudomonadota bacterium]
MHRKDNSPTASGPVLEAACQDEPRARAILDAIPDLIWLKDVHGIYLDCNSAVERLLGVEKCDIVGKNDDDFFDSDLVDFIRQRDREVCVSDKSISYEEWLTFAENGQCRLYETTKTPMRDAGGKLIGVLGIARDISERAQCQINDDRLYRSEVGIDCVLDCAADAIFIADPQGNYQYVNEQAVQLLGYSREELLRMCVGDLTPREDLADVRRLLQPLYSTGALRCELRLRHRSGDSIPVDFNGSMLPDGRAYSSYRDIRARKLADTEREQHRELLVREVHHRIKNNLQGVAGLLQRELGKFHELDSRLDVAISQINSIAVVHGLQAVYPDEGMHLGASLGNICHMVAKLAQRPVLFQSEDERTAGQFKVAHNDAVSVALVLNELVLNAIKHSPPGYAPEVSLQAAGVGVKLLISNNVIRVPDFNFDSGEKLGTGLSLVRSLLPRQGARLSYRFGSPPGFMLTTLFLTTPVVQAPEEVDDK